MVPKPEHQDVESDISDLSNLSSRDTTGNLNQEEPEKLHGDNIGTGTSGTTPLDRSMSRMSGISRTMSRVSYNSRKSGDGPDLNAVDLIADDPELQRKLTRIETHIDPNYDDLNEADPWGYPLDENTGLRLVNFVEDDELDPRNMSKARKWLITVVLGLVCFCVAFSSAIVTGDIHGPKEYFNVSTEVIILTVTLFVIGFGIGPLVFAPASELFGRQIVYITTFFFALAFILPCALARNIGTLLVGRFIDGIAFSAPMTLIGGSLADIWRAEERGVAMAVFSAAPFIGPAMGPLIGGFIGDYLYWRWIYWIMLMFAGFCTCLMLITVPETHHDTLLRRRVKKLIKLTGDHRYRILKDVSPPTLKEMIHVTLLRPIILLTEPIVLFMTLYMTVLYGLLYMFFFAYPVVFNEGKGWPDHRTGLMFIPLGIGIILGASTAPFVNNDYNKRCHAYASKGEHVPPEVRLIPMMWGCWFIPVGMFIFGWTSYPHLSWWGPAMGGFPVGIGFILLYNSVNNYLIDTYVHVAASALAAKTMVRSFWGAAAVLFTIQMYHRLGYEWASSLLAFIALACCLIPFVFYIFGKRIRARSKFAYDYENEPEQ